MFCVFVLVSAHTQTSVGHSTWQYSSNHFIVDDFLSVSFQTLAGDDLESTELRSLTRLRTPDRPSGYKRTTRHTEPIVFALSTTTATQDGRSCCRSNCGRTGCVHWPRAGGGCRHRTANTAPQSFLEPDHYLVTPSLSVSTQGRDCQSKNQAWLTMHGFAPDQQH